MEREEAELEDVDDNEEEDELVGLRADCDAASYPNAPRPCALLHHVPRRRCTLRPPRTRPTATTPWSTRRPSWTTWMMMRMSRSWSACALTMTP